MDGFLMPTQTRPHFHPYVTPHGAHMVVGTYACVCFFGGAGSGLSGPVSSNADR